MKLPTRLPRVPTHTWAVLALTFGVVASSTGDDKPAALKALENSRNAMLTGHIEFSVRSYQAGDPLEVAQYYSGRFAGDDYLLQHRGDREGVLVRNDDGSPAGVLAHRPYYQLLHDGKEWTRRETDIFAKVQLIPTNVIDARCFGVCVGLPQGISYYRSIWGSGGEIRDYTVRELDGLYEVTSVSRSSGWKVRWLLDPERDWNVVRRTVINRHGKVLREAVTTLKKFGDTWFPERSELYQSDFEDGKKPIYVIQVSSASFNKPGQPLRFTPRDIGIDVGMPLEVHKDASSPRKYAKMGWDGEALVPLKELWARIRKGELEKGELYTAALTRNLAMGHTPEARLQLWERYTRGFIQRYRLNDDQAQRAESFLKSCQERAKSMFARSKDEYDAIRKTVAEIEKDESMGSEKQAIRMSELRERMVSLLAPIPKIFYLELKPRLNRLPTRAQRAAVAEQEFEKAAKKNP